MAGGFALPSPGGDSLPTAWRFAQGCGSQACWSPAPLSPGADCPQCTPITGIQVQMLHRLVQSLDVTLVNFLRGEHLDFCMRNYVYNLVGRKGPSRQFGSPFQWLTVRMVGVMVCQNGRFLFQKSATLDCVTGENLNLIDGNLWLLRANGI